MITKFNNQEAPESVTSVYTQATKLSPISKTKKDKVLADYGVQSGWSKGKSDTAISAKAADAVLIKFKADKAKAAADAKAAAEKITHSAASQNPTLRVQAAAIARRYGVDPAKLFGYGVKGFTPNWLLSADAAYVWRDAASFEDWLKRAIRDGTMPR